MSSDQSPTQGDWQGEPGADESHQVVVTFSTVYQIWVANVSWSQTEYYGGTGALAALAAVLACPRDSAVRVWLESVAKRGVYREVVPEDFLSPGNPKWR